METTTNFKHFQKTEDRYSSCISEITDCQIVGYTTRLKAPCHNILRESTC